MRINLVCPMFVLENSIIPNYEAKKCTNISDTLILNVYGNCKYEHYMDDGDGFEYQEGKYNKYLFTYQNNILEIDLIHAGLKSKLYKKVIVKNKNNTFEIDLSNQKNIKVEL